MQTVTVGPSGAYASLQAALAAIADGAVGFADDINVVCADFVDTVALSAPYINLVSGKRLVIDAPGRGYVLQTSGMATMSASDWTLGPGITIESTTGAVPFGWACAVRFILMAWIKAGGASYACSNFSGSAHVFDRLGCRVTGLAPGGVAFANNISAHTDDSLLAHCLLGEHGMWCYPPVTLIAKNCVSLSADDPWPYVSDGGGSTNNYSAVGSFGANPRTGTPTLVNRIGGDFRPAAGDTVLSHQGVTVAAMPTDVEGVAWSGTPTLGPLNPVSTGGGTPTVDSVTVSPSSASIVAGTTQQYTATVAVSNGASQAVTWASSNPGVATVNATTGLATGVSAGTATITATSVADGTKTHSRTLTVTAAPAPVIALTGPSDPAFRATQGGSNPSPAVQSVSNSSGGAALTNLRVQAITYANGQPTGWLSANVAGGNLTRGVTVGSLRGFQKLQATVTLRADNASADLVVPVTFRVLPATSTTGHASARRGDGAMLAGHAASYSVDRPDLVEYNAQTGRWQAKGNPSEPSVPITFTPSGESASGEAITRTMYRHDFDFDTL